MKRISTIMMAMLLSLGLMQCKKSDLGTLETDESVRITLNVGHSRSLWGDGTRAEVNPATGGVDYEEGDRIYVASDGRYVGTLTYDGTSFTGSITDATEGIPLQFYYLGNVEPAEALTAGVTDRCSVVISDQTEHLPVISAAPSRENYYESLTSYSSELLNKCVLVRFKVTTMSTAATSITSFNNKVTVNFADGTFAGSKKGEGVITLPAGSGDRYAILLPQEAVGFGSAYSMDGPCIYIGTHGELPALHDNDYLTSGIPVTITTKILPEGVIDALFTVSETRQVFFSRGNLQYQASTNIWRFAENQWEFVGDSVVGNVFEYGTKCNNTFISSDYAGWIDLFGWGTSGFKHGALCSEPWCSDRNSSEYYAYGSKTLNLYDEDGRADWGYNAISNGGNQMNSGWRTLTQEEWDYLYNTRVTPSGIRYAKARVNGVAGVILLPDNWDASYYALVNPNEPHSGYENILTEAEWTDVFEANGAVFLPPGGRRYGSDEVRFAGVSGYYWSSSSFNRSDAIDAYFSNGYFNPLHKASRKSGRSVRLVLNAH